MHALWQAPAALIVLVTWLTSAPVSLADIAQREALRRQATPRATTAFTNDDLPLMAPAAVSGVRVEAKDEAGEQAAEASAATDATEAATDEPDEVRDEAWWREHFTTARTTLAENRRLLAETRTKVAALQTDFVSLDDPAQRELVRQALDDATAEAQRLEAQVGKDETAMLDLIEQARRAGIPPGWVR